MENKVKILYVGNMLPMSEVERLNLSIAGKKYEIDLNKAINEKNKDLLISISNNGNKLDEIF